MRHISVIGLLALILLGGCSEGVGSSASGSSSAMAEDPGVVHVHGLRINPKDGILYAATHTGLFRIPDEGRAERIGDRWQDTMGFTVVGPDRFLGSGHPDARDYQAKRLPSLFGRIESRDAGATWQPLSLQGQADFHALRAVHGRIYGFDSTSGTFMVSADGKGWETRPKLPTVDFAVSPNDPDLIVATIQGGLQHSRDGGRTWEASGPAFVFLAWPDPAALWGVTAAGALFLSADTGGSWRQVGVIPGKPNALLAAASVSRSRTRSPSRCWAWATCAPRCTSAASSVPWCSCATCA